MKWITREKVKVDRVACPWLIKKFVDPLAEFIFVPSDKVMDEAKRLGAIPYDVKDVELGHHGKECSFEAILKKYNLNNDPALCAHHWRRDARNGHRHPPNRAHCGSDNLLARSNHPKLA